MASIQVRGMPDPLYWKLKEAARREHRSLAQQAIVAIERGLDMPRERRQERQRILSDLLARPLAPRGNVLKNPAELVREDRDR